MKVKDLITALGRCDGDLEVLIPQPCGVNLVSAGTVIVCDNHAVLLLEEQARRIEINYTIDVRR
jgi:hypothetical protein